MEYLASENMIHRDLAARNCMYVDFSRLIFFYNNYYITEYRIDMHMVIRVVDFGLSVNTGTKEYYHFAGDMGFKLPVMWMAPESLSDYVFSEKSDVVS